MLSSFALLSVTPLFEVSVESDSVITSLLESFLLSSSSVGASFCRSSILTSFASASAISVSTLIASSAEASDAAFISDFILLRATKYAAYESSVYVPSALLKAEPSLEIISAFISLISTKAQQ